MQKCKLTLIALHTRMPSSHMRTPILKREVVRYKPFHHHIHLFRKHVLRFVLTIPNETIDERKELEVSVFFACVFNAS